MDKVRESVYAYKRRRGGETEKVRLGDTCVTSGVCDCMCTCVCTCACKLYACMCLYCMCAHAHVLPFFKFNDSGPSSVHDRFQ